MGKLNPKIYNNHVEELNPQLRTAKDAVVLFGSSIVFLGMTIATLLTASFHKPKEKVAIVNFPPKVQVLRNWGLENIYHSDVQARKAWEITKGSSSVVVAVIDTGIDAQHTDLKDNLWTKPGTTDEYGWDFVKNEKNPSDTNGHGTHVAGIIAATDKAQAGASGIAPNVKLMVIKYFSSTAAGSTNITNSIKAFDYAIDNGAQIINYSSSGMMTTQAEYEVFKRAEAKGILVVEAAGNEGFNHDKDQEHHHQSSFPAAYSQIFSNVITVGSLTIEGKLLESSNSGAKVVQVAAPGQDIFSTLPGNRYGFLTGTSQATPFVAGTAALLLSKQPDLKPQEIRNILMASVDVIPGLEGSIQSSGRLNAFQALQISSFRGHPTPVYDLPADDRALATNLPLVLR